LLFISIFIGEYAFKKIGLDFKLFVIIPELISLAIGAYALIYFGINKGIKIRWHYLFLFLAFSVHITIGILVNQVQPFAVIAGLRTYLKFLPFYLLPLVYIQPEKEILSQLKLLLFLAVAQLPLALYQRFFEFSGSKSGDLIAGTLTAAPILTLFLICTISVLVGFYLKKRLTGKAFTILVFALFVPTAINETKATLILLPMALLVPTIFHLSKEARIKILVKMIPICILLLVGFHYAYKAFFVWGSKHDVFSFYTSGKVQEYLYKGAEADEVVGGLESEVGRIDAIVLAYKENSKDFFRLIWGAGIGNAAVSFSKNFQGEYTDEYKRLGGKQNSISHFLWEIGFLGIAHIIWFLVLVFVDALNLRNCRGIVGPVALGWLGVTVVFLISLPYQNIITKNELIYPFIYISGILTAWSSVKTTRAYDEDENLFPAPTVNQVF
jgi:hypothetical protein